MTLNNLLTISEPHFSNECDKKKRTLHRVLGGIKDKHEVLGTGPHILYRPSVVAVVFTSSIKVMEIPSVRIPESHSVQAEAPACRSCCSELRALIDGMLNQAGAATLSPSLIFTDGAVCCPRVFDLQGTGRCVKAEVGPWRRELLR